MRYIFEFLIGLLIVSTTIPLVNCARILAVFPSPSKSHLLIHSSVAETLASDGHNVTVIALFPDVLKNTKYSSYLHIEGKMPDKAFTNDMVNKPQPFYMIVNQLLEVVFDCSNDTINHPKMQEFLQTHKAGDFDVLLFGYFMNDFMLGLGAHFQCPIIISFMVQPILPINMMIGNPLEVPYVPSLFGNIQPPMTFVLRLKNYLATGFERLIMANLMKWMNNKHYRQVEA